MKYYLILVCVIQLIFVPLLSAKEYRIVTGLKSPMSDYYFAIEKEAFKRIGHNVSQKLLPAARSIQLTDQGVFDGDCCRIKKITKLYSNVVIVPEPVFTLRFTAFTKNKSIIIKKWSDIKPYNVGSISGFKLIQIKTNEVAPKSFRQLPDSTAMFRMLDAGRIDVALLNYVDAKLLIKTLGLKNITTTLPALSSVPVYFTLHKKNKGLIKPLDDAFKAMKADGTWRKIEEEVFK